MAKNELSIDELKVQLAQEKEARAAADTARAVAEQAQRDAVAEVVEVRQQLTDAHGTISALEADNAKANSWANENLERATSAEQLATELNEELSRAGSATGPATVKLGAEQYEVVAGKFKFGGKSYTRADVKSDSTLLQELVAAGAGVIRKVA